MDTTGIEEDVSSITSPASLWIPAQPGDVSARAITDNVVIYLTWALSTFLTPLVLLLSIVTGVINITAFSRVNLSQGVNLNLLILSASDYAVSVLLLAAFVVRSLLLLGYAGGELLPKVVKYLLVVFNFPLNLSVLVITVIAIARCCCVVMPLSFRGAFTARRQLIAISGLGFIIWTLILFAVIGGRMAITVRFNPGANSSDGTVSERKHYMSSEIGILFDYIRNVYYYCCLSVIGVSVVFLTIALKQSAQFQRDATSSRSTNLIGQHLNARLATREAQVVKTVILVLAIFIACNVPLTLLSFLRLTVPGFNPNGEYALYYALLYETVGVTAGLNTGVNFFVYLNFNSVFRENVKKMFTTPKATTSFTSK